MMKILVVDDDRDLCEILSDFLKDEGYTVITAYGGESALSEIKNENYDLLILDYRLCGMNGLHFLEKAHQIDSSLIAIMISAFGSEQIRSQAQKLGVYDFVEKPFDMEKMVAAVNQVLHQRR
jgi:DNA-binding response OmpR family regulator